MRAAQVLAALVQPALTQLRPLLRRLPRIPQVQLLQSIPKRLALCQPTRQQLELRQPALHRSLLGLRHLQLGKAQVAPSSSLTIPLPHPHGLQLAVQLLLLRPRRLSMS